MRTGWKILRTTRNYRRISNTSFLLWLQRTCIWCLRSLEAAGRKISTILLGIVLRLQGEDNYITEELFSSLLDALYPNQDSSAVEVYQVEFIRAIIRAKGDIAQKLITERHMKNYPKLGLTVMASMEKVMQVKVKEKERTIKHLFGDLSQMKKRKWRDCKPG